MGEMGRGERRDDNTLTQRAVIHKRDACGTVVTN